MSVAQKVVSTKIPARMDRLPWTRWHWFVVFALGIVWVLDGLEVTIKGAVGPSLRDSLSFTTVGVAGVASIYLLGAVTGALFWGYLTDKFGRAKLFIATIAVYLVGVIGTSITGLWVFGDGFEYVWFAIFRFITGFGIGGEYAAINSTIDELIPARVRGWVDLAINGSYWVGTVVGAILGAVYLNVLGSDVAFRVAFGTGLILGAEILLMRFFVPESPRWLITHGREEEAEHTVAEIERDVMDEAELDDLPEPEDDDAIEIRERRAIGFIELGRTLFKLYPRRSVVAFSLMLTQAFLYNAIFFTFGLMLTTYFGVGNANVGWFLVPFGVGNYLGPLVLGKLFDTVGRRTMIPLTFLTAAALTVVAGLLFATGVIGTAWLMTLFWVGIFFFASAGASAGYLTASETFPLEVRAMAISFFYALPTFCGGVFGPLLFGALINGGQRWTVFWGYLIGAALMALGGVIHRVWGVEAAQRGLESIAMPLSVQEAEGADTGRAALRGPAGVDIADPEDVRRFQRDHGLATDGLIGPATSAALRTAADGHGDVSSVDVTDADDVRRFQAESGLVPDGVVGAETRGALLATERRAVIDPADRESVARFQRTHLLPDDGEIGPETEAALRAVRAERTGAAEETIEPDPLDRESIERFQHACGLAADGVIGPETRGAIRAERARRLRGRETSRPMHEELVERSRFGVDPADGESVTRFQREVGLDDDGCVGPETRHALRRAPHLLLGIDPTDRESIERFQAAHELKTDGVIGPETQAVLRTLQQRHSETGRDEEPDDGEELDKPRGLLAFDPADRDAVERFQRDHGLEPDGLVGPRTQAALRAAMADQEQELMARPARRPTSGARGAPYRRRGLFAGMPLASSLPGADRELERELEDVVDALRRRGTLSRREVGDEVNARLWGPGRLRYVLRAGQEAGVLRRTGRDRWAAA
ncbi:MAG TPA: MFS transporter [Solirubrobacteraceae bacterium]|nr:MFS transporter [Solirubrobacteraceae bacterium]